MRQAVVLLGVGGHNVRANRRVRTVAEALSTRTDADSSASAPPGPEALCVEPAYVQAGSYGATPSLGEAVERLVQGGVGAIAIVPFLLEWPYPEHLDVPDLVRDLAEAYPNVRFHLGRVLGSTPELVDILASRMEEVWQSPELRTMPPSAIAELTEQTPITTAAFHAGVVPNLPPQEQHTFLCTGRRCSELGSEDLYRRLASLLAERGLDAGPHRVKLTRAKCLGPCAAGPVVCLYPRGLYAVGLSSDLMPAFVDEVLVAGGALDGHTFEPEAARPTGRATHGE